MWLSIILLAAVFLGLYDIAQKRSLNNNSVIMVLFCSILTSSIVLTPCLLVSVFSPSILEKTPFFVPFVDWETHLFIVVKSLIVLSSWLFGYAGMKNLPLTIVTPIKATQPMWTVLGAMLIFAERLNLAQTIGVAVILCCFYLFSMVGKREGIYFRSNKWVWCLLASTLIGASSGLYDKYLMCHFDKMAVLVYYTYYQLIGMGMILLYFVWKNKKSEIVENRTFQWRWSIPFIGIFLSCSDFLYFYALSLPDSLIAVISPLRRTGMILAFAYGAICYREKNKRAKLWCLIGMVVGVVFLYGGTM